MRWRSLPPCPAALPPSRNRRRRRAHPVPASAPTRPSSRALPPAAVAAPEASSAQPEGAPGFAAPVPVAYVDIADRDRRLVVWTLGISIVLHAVVLAIRFQPFDLSNMFDRGPMLEVALVNAKSLTKPTKADILAQAHLDGGGNTDADRRAKTPLPVMPKEESGNDVSVATQQTVALERRTQELLTQLRNSRDARGRAEAGRRAADRRCADGRRNGAAHDGSDAARGADREGHGRLPEAPEAEIRRRARGGVPVRPLRRGLAAQGRAGRKPQLSGSGARAEALRRPAAHRVDPRRRQHRERRDQSSRPGIACSTPPP